MNTIQAENIDIDRKYSSTDIITLINTYDFKLKTSEKVEYKIDVVGDGYVNVFLTTENDPNLFSNYIIEYSTEEDVKSYHKTFSNGAKYDTEEFSILILNTENYDVTYEISIKISDDSWGDAISLVLAGLLVFCVVVLPIIFVKYMRHKKKTNINTNINKQQIFQYPCNICGNVLQYIEPNKQYFCNTCQRYIPGESQNDDRLHSTEYLYGYNR